MTTSEDIYSAAVGELEKKMNIFFVIFISPSVDSIAVQLLDEKIKTASIPDITGDADTPVGHVSYSLSRYVYGVG